MLSENKVLLTEKEYFIKSDDIEYKCLLCGTVNKIKYYTYKNVDNVHICKGCRELETKKAQYEKMCAIAKESSLKVLTTFDEYVKDNNKFNEKRITFECSCTNVFTTALGEFLYDNKRQCNKCGIATRSGEFAPRWKGGITPEVERIRKSPEYKEWRNAVFERDNYTCCCCGNSTGGNLRAHHIENFSDNEELRFDVTNGITLCDKCHNPSVIGSFHHTYGTYNNTLG